ncbi:hypothetical protein AG1IA_01560 [Rhizoctonia solani AG-1 IA]|uniref:Prenyltransferase alpha-alpha toroid domain-containing protein n=1 Tax=Thanatephorus cucumeris (strain AG1-IA) TaxID=983506 RepID=L8X271_THACA|nr:hypothetical protein AG1IA_01560 [Rhizoctonia solani AG-1 IA]
MTGQEQPTPEYSHPGNLISTLTWGISRWLCSQYAHVAQTVLRNPSSQSNCHGHLNMSLCPLARNMHIALNYRCLGGLGSGAVEADDSRSFSPTRMAIAFYSLAAMDLYGVVTSKSSEKDRAEWTQWIWAQYTQTAKGTGFRGGDSLVLPKPNVSLLSFSTGFINQTKQPSSSQKPPSKLYRV